MLQVVTSVVLLVNIDGSFAITTADDADVIVELNNATSNAPPLQVFYTYMHISIHIKIYFMYVRMHKFTIIIADPRIVVFRV